MNPNAKKTLIAISAVFGGIFILFILVNILEFFVVVGAGERGILLQFGNVQKIYEPGLHFQVPFLNQVVVMDVRSQKSQDVVQAASKDLQSIEATVATNFHLDPGKVDNVYKEIGLEYIDRIIKPAVQESMKAVTAQYTAEELITKRPVVKEEIRRILGERLSANNIVVDDVSIVNFNFSEEFNRSIESKQTAVQNALRAENDLKRIQIEAQQVIEKAKADAESIRIQGDALSKNPELVKLKAVEKWDGKLPLSTSGNALPFLQLPVSQ